MGVHDGHRDRKKAQYRRCGSEPFADHELLELLLFFAIPRVDTNPAAHALLDRFGSLQAVFTASVDELAKVPHIGPNAALLISLIPTLYRRAMVSAANSEFVLDTRARMGEYFRELLSAEPKEVMYQLCLDAKGRRRNIYRVGEGDVVEVYGPHNSVNEAARLAGTISYELTCAVSKRVPRIYMKNGVEVARELLLRA